MMVLNCYLYRNPTVRLVFPNYCTDVDARLHQNYNLQFVASVQINYNVNRLEE